MRVAAIYDIHGNLPALESVLREIRRLNVDVVVVGGDVLPGPMPRETLDCLLKFDRPVQFIVGNGDREVLSQMKGIETDWFRSAQDQWREPVRWSAQQLQQEHQTVLESWPAKLQLEVPGIGGVLFCHATPRNDTDVFTRQTPEERLLPIFDGLDASLVVCGHTHMQFDRIIGKVRVVNAGSVGMPYGESGAYWLLLGPKIELRRTSYDLTATAEHFGSTKYPQAKEFALNHILQPPAESQILELLSRMELR